MQFSPASSYFLPFMPMSSSAPCFEHPQFTIFATCQKKLHTHKTQQKITVSYTSNAIYTYRPDEKTEPESNCIKHYLDLISLVSW